MDEECTLKQQLEGMLARMKARGRKDKIAELEEQLALPVFPVLLRYVWGWFLELSSRERQYSGMGDALPLNSQVLLAWMRLRRIRLTPFELQCIRDLDDTYLTVKAKAAKEERKRNGGSNGGRE